MTAGRSSWRPWATQPSKAYYDRPRRAGPYKARGQRITYADTKDLLVLEGDGRADVELFRQARIGDPVDRVAARKIFYWPKTNRLKVDGRGRWRLAASRSGTK